jgi:hypothetical protein
MLSTIDATANGRTITLHLPMMDFACDPKSATLRDITVQPIIVAAFLESGFSLEELEFYESGHSFHAYGLNPVPYYEWTRFMGTMLLLNLPNWTRAVDDRWVGHRLLKGYGALRWTCNNPKYKQVPSHMECPF